MAGAADFCVSSAAELQDALNTAAGNNQADVIQIVQGTYLGNFFYQSAQTFGITIEGGYTADCISREVNPLNTKLDGEANSSVMRLEYVGGGDIVVEGLTFENGTQSGLVANSLGFLNFNNNLVRNNSAGSGGGVFIRRCAQITLQDNVFIYNHAGTGGGIDIVGGYIQEITLVNNLFSNNYTTVAEGGAIHIKYVSATINLVNNVISNNATTIWLGGGHGGGAHISTYPGFGTVNFINNTVVGNSAGPHCGGGITVYYTTAANIYNNIFWANSAGGATDICFTGVSPSTVNLFHNDLDYTGISGLGSFSIDPSNLDAVDPLFVDLANEDYHLQDLSPCRDTGTNEAPELQPADKDGQPRIVNEIVDMGAYEYPGQIDPLLPDLFGKMEEFHYYKSEEQIVVEFEVKNRGTRSGRFRVAFYLSASGVAFGPLIDEYFVNRPLNTGQRKTVQCQSSSPTSLSDKYLFAVIDADDQVVESVETNNRIRCRIP